MSDVIELAAEKREIIGKKVRNLRRAGLVPATIYEKGKDSLSVSVSYIPFSKVYNQAGLGQPVELDLEGKKILTMIKEVAVDPAKNTYVHVAFHAVNANEPVEAEIPVQIEGEIEAEKLGNFIVRPNDHVQVKALPANLPEFLAVGAEKLVNPGDLLTVADLAVPANVEILSDPATVLAVVEEPRKIEEPEPEETESEAADVPSEHGSEDSGEAEKPEDKK